MLIGVAFDPSSTADNLILWVSHTFFAFNNGPDWTGKISRLTGPNLATYQDVRRQSAALDPGPPDEQHLLRARRGAVREPGLEHAPWALPTARGASARSAR